MLLTGILRIKTNSLFLPTQTRPKLFSRMDGFHKKEEISWHSQTEIEMEREKEAFE